jgi:uncharacterized protein (DUF1778 family)
VSKNRTNVLGVRLSPDERKLVNQAAELQQRTVCDWARLLLIQAANDSRDDGKQARVAGRKGKP